MQPEPRTAVPQEDDHIALNKILECRGRAERASPTYLRSERTSSPNYDERGPTMITTRLAIATLVAVGLAGAPFAAQGKKYKHIRHYISMMQSDNYGMSGMSTTRSGSYGTSGNSVGTVTAPSVGSYSW